MSHTISSHTDIDAPSHPRRRVPLPSFTVQIFLGLGIGIALGLLASYLQTNEGDGTWLIATMNWIGSSFVTLLKTLVPPLVFAAMVVSINNLKGVANAASLAVKTLIWFAITALASVITGIVLGLIVSPGLHTSVTKDAADMPSRVGQWSDFLQGLVPSNFLGLEVRTRMVEDALVSSPSFNALQILVIGIAIGIAALKVGEAAQPFITVVDALLKVLQKVLWGVIRLAPIGTAGLIGHAVATYGWDKVASLGWFVLTIYIGLLIVAGVIYPVVLRLNGLSPIAFYRGAWPAMQLGFVSRSSLGTMPVTQQVTAENLGVNPAYSSFAVSLGATTKMDGCAAIYPAVASIFVAQFFGIELAITDYLIIAFVAVVGSAATAGLTGATVMLTLTLSTLGLPLEGVGLLLAVDPILDMGRTAVNVAGQALVPTVVAAREGLLDRVRFMSRTKGEAIATTE